MHYAIELLYSLWRRLRDAVLGLVTRPEVPAPMVTTPTDRRELFAQLATLRATRAAEAEQSRHESDTLTARWRETQTAADEIQRQINILQREAFCSSLDHTAAEDRLLRQITEKSSMSVQLFIEELAVELSVLHRIEDTSIPTAHRDYIVGKKTMGLSTDAVSRKHRAAALNAARQRAMAMQLQELSIEQINAGIIALRKSIPAIEQQTIFTERTAILAAV